MAIIIPSKDIYEINNQKVVDNEVDNVEVGAKNVVSKNEYGVTVYSEDIFNAEKTTSSEQDFDADFNAEVTQAQWAVVGLQVFSEYRTKTIYIPRTQSTTSIINQILTKKDSNGNNNIGVRLFGNIKKGTASNSLTFDYSYMDGATYDDKRRFSFNWGNTAISEEPETQEDYQLNTSQTNEYEASRLGYSVHATITINADEDNTASITADEQFDDFFILNNIKVLCGMKIVKLTSVFSDGALNNETQDKNETYKYHLPMEGTYEEYIPSLVELTFKGNTIGIDLEDETVKIGDGQHVYSFSGNELMQTSNKKTTSCLISVGDFVRSDGDSWSVYSVVQSRPAIHSGDVLIYNGEKAYCISTSPAQISVQNNGEWAKMSNVHISFTSYKEEGSQIENYYKNVISQWRNGKEVATIKCGMVDYYQSVKQENYITVYGVRNISLKKCSISGNVTYALPNKENLLSVYVTISGSKYKMYSISLANNNTVLTGEIDLSYRDVQLQQYELSYEYMETTPAISVKETGLPMTFHIGDTVIPYIKGADGSDKPMSYYMDKATPKEFLVIGKGITADGEILQELTLQEIPQV